MKFSDFLKDLDHGRVDEALSEQLEAVTSAVQETAQPGSVTLTLSISKEGMHAAVNVKSQQKIPTHPMHGTLFYWDDKNPGRLRRDDPRQLQIKELAPRELKEVD
ncbi:MAG: hypothetical protein KJ995_08260 [Candidatus Omnitrophica bacterium]|nr:hypothetical protein [Candidatus Omnitrophota bacterium]MBU1785281.1 hypothetical protein [Candidatus Omnitrophota bacterium]MBU1852380.1 hypothetical protein [Candidatus Omnitrophota bacterium]